MKHKKQHFVPRSYLKKWCDTNTPDGQEPYVWQFSKDGKIKKNKSPENIFYENDMYTIIDKNNNRNLVLEHGLQSLEDLFCRIRDDIIIKRKKIDKESKYIICAFMAAMHSRTICQREHLKSQWQNLLDVGNMVQKAYSTATKEQKKSMELSSRLHSNGPSLTLEEVKELADNPIKKTLFTQIEVEIPLIFSLDLAIFNTYGKPGFITSDNPCLWYDPEAYKRQPLYRSPAIAYPSIEIRLPVTPEQFIVLNRQKITGHVDLFPTVANEFNRVTRFNCYKHFIVNCDYLDDYWYYEGKEPDDSWENRNKKA